MPSHRSLRLALCVVVALSLLAVASPAAGAPPPRPLCDACGDSFADTAEAYGLDVDVERSDATVTVHENGTATWVVRNHLGASTAVDRLRTNATLRADVGDRAMWDAEFRGADVSADGVLTLRYREQEFAERSVGGAYRSGAFTASHGYRNLDGLGADRLTVVAPPGTSVGWTVAGATVADDGRQMNVTELDEGGFVTFVPDDALAGPLWSLVAVGSLVGPLLALRALAFGAVPVATFSIVVGAASGGVSWFGGELDRFRRAAGPLLAGVGLVAVALALVAATGVPVVGGAAPLALGGGLVALVGSVAHSRPTVRERATYRSLVVGAAAGTFVAAGVAVVAAPAFSRPGPGQSLPVALAALGPVFSLLPAGYAIGRENRRLAVGTAVAGYVLATVALLPGLPSPLGLGLLLVFVAVAHAVGALVVGSPLLVVGVVLGAGRADDVGSEPPIES